MGTTLAWVPLPHGFTPARGPTPLGPHTGIGTPPTRAPYEHPSLIGYAEARAVGHPSHTSNVLELAFPCHFPVDHIFTYLDVEMRDTVVEEETAKEEEEEEEDEEEKEAAEKDEED